MPRLEVWEKGVRVSAGAGVWCDQTLPGRYRTFVKMSATATEHPVVSELSVDAAIVQEISKTETLRQPIQMAACSSQSKGDSHSVQLVESVCLGGAWGTVGAQMARRSGFSEPICRPRTKRVTLTCQPAQASHRAGTGRCIGRTLMVSPRSECEARR